MVFAITMILLGSLSESVGSLNRPWIEGETGVTPGTTGDHPWGGDNVTTGTGTSTPSARAALVPSTGIGSVDLVLRVYFYKYMSRFTTGRSVRATETSQPQVITEDGNSNSTTAGSTPTDNQ
jgi:hypothetical protein